jgi:hypothetical protein
MEVEAEFGGGRAPPRSGLVQRLELSVTPADSLRLWQASSESDNVVKNGNEPGMQAGKWGAAASATSGVRSNATLDSGRCMSNILCTFLPPVGDQQPVKNSRKMSRLNAQIEVLHAMSASTKLCGSAITHFAF